MTLWKWTNIICALQVLFEDFCVATEKKSVILPLNDTKLSTSKRFIEAIKLKFLKS